MKLTRRELASTLAAGAAMAQTPAQPRTPEAELQAARDQLKATLVRLSAQAVPMTTEPAFQFKP
jgi:hypothetical protein